MSHRTNNEDQDVAPLIEQCVSELASTDRLEQRKIQRASRRTAFRRRLMHRWRDSLNTLDELIATCAELGDAIAQIYHDETNLFLALDLLRNRAVQIGWEVHNLTSSGFADGAYARWRTLHEIAVVSEFLQNFGEEAALRYFKHAHIKNRQVLREYNKCQVRLGYPAIPEAEIQHSDDMRRQLLDQYGKDFGYEWGWATMWCGKNFSDLREMVGYEHWQAHYGMANHAVHAGPHGILFRLGHPLSSKPLPLSGPSLVGLGDPVHASAISLMHTTFSFVTAARKKCEARIEDEFKFTALVKYLQALAEQIGEQVKVAHELIEHEFGVHETGTERGRGVVGEGDQASESTTQAG